VKQSYSLANPDSFKWNNALTCKLIFAINQDISNNDGIILPFDKVDISWNKIATELNIPEDKIKHKWQLLLMQVTKLTLIAKRYLTFTYSSQNLDPFIYFSYVHVYHNYD